MSVGQRIKARRKQLGMNAETLAEKLGISPATIYRYENGDIEKVDSTKLIAIAEVLGTTPAALMGWEDKDGGETETTANESNEARRVSAGIDRMPPDVKKKFFDYMDMSIFASYFKRPDADKED